jgi:hypothetical protein
MRAKAPYRQRYSAQQVFRRAVGKVAGRDIIPNNVTSVTLLSAQAVTRMADPRIGYFVTSNELTIIVIACERSSLTALTANV